jgi:hypothetical protein
VIRLLRAGRLPHDRRGVGEPQGSAGEVNGRTSRPAGRCARPG